MFLDPVLVGQLAEGDFVFAYNRRYIGYFALASSVFFSVRIFFEKATAMDSLYLCCSFSLMLWLGGRGTVVAYTGTIIIVCVLLYLHNNLSIRKTCTLAMILIASCAISMPLSIYEWNGLNRFQLLSETLNAIESGSVLSRFKLWQESIQLFSASPWFGLGADGYKLFSITHFFQPHNVVFQCLVEFGFIGTSCILYLLNRAVTIMARTSTSHLDPPLISLMAVVIALFIQSLVSGNLYHAGSIAQFFMFLAMTLALCVQVKSSSRELVEHNSSATSSQID
jgi:O-antigen ligase